MFYVDAAAVIEFGTRYNIVFKRILLYCYHLYTGTGLMIWGCNEIKKYQSQSFSDLSIKFFMLSLAQLVHPSILPLPHSLSNHQSRQEDIHSSKHMNPPQPEHQYVVLNRIRVNLN